MDIIVFCVVLIAAALHAIWNALVKGGSDKHLSMVAVALGRMPIAIALLPFIPLPKYESLPYIFTGIALHVGYQLFLLASYRVGDLTQVYPIARGVAPILVAIILFLFLGTQLKPIELTAVVTIGLGIMSLSLVRQKDGLRNPKAAVLALITGCFIASYSINDGLGARLAGTALGYYVWVTIGNAVIFTTFIWLKKPAVIRNIPSHAKQLFLFGGSASFIAYALIIWSFTQAPIAIVTAVRETSIIFAILIGVFFLKEKLDLAKLCSTFVTFFGIALLKFSK